MLASAAIWATNCQCWEAISLDPTAAVYIYKDAIGKTVCRCQRINGPAVAVFDRNGHVWPQSTRRAERTRPDTQFIDMVAGAAGAAQRSATAGGPDEKGQERSRADSTDGSTRYREKRSPRLPSGIRRCRWTRRHSAVKTGERHDT